MIKIALLSGALTGNRGSEAMNTSAIGRINELLPDAEFGVFTYSYREDVKVFRSRHNVCLFNYAPFHLVVILLPCALLAGFLKKINFTAAKKIFPAPIRFLWGCRAAIDVAGVAFMDSRLRFLPFNVLSIYAGFLMQVPVIKFAQALGPFTKWVNLTLARHCFRRCAHIYVRGDATYQNMQQLHLYLNTITTSPDVAFCHTNADIITCENEEKVIRCIEKIREWKRKKKKIVGISPSSLIASGKKGEHYKSFLVSLTEQLLDQGVHLVFIPNSSRERKPHVWRNNDLPLLWYLSDKISCENENALFLTLNMNAVAVKEILKECDTVITSRFHAMIFALSLNVPVYVVGWSHKYHEIMQEYGMRKYVVDYTKVNVEDVCNVVGEMLDQKEEMSKRIAEITKSVKQKSFRQIEETVSFIMRKEIDEKIF